MITLTSKVCVVGDFAVGKTSVVERYVNNHFSEKYLTTVGVKIDTKEIEFTDRRISQKLVIWDVAGADRFGPTEMAYLRGANGYIYVADGTRPLTLGATDTIHGQVTETYGPAPAVMLVNKRDLVADWGVREDRLLTLRATYGDVYETSAKGGDNVESAIIRLAEKIIEADFRDA